MNLVNLQIAYNYFLPRIDDPVINQGFDMREYGMLDSQNEIDFEKCGTVGCMIGWFPTVPGLEPMVDDIDKFTGFDYDKYSDRILNDSDSPEWYFLFANEWKLYDNTLKGALKRIKYILDGNGIPLTYYGLFNAYSEFAEGWEYPLN